MIIIFVCITTFRDNRYLSFNDVMIQTQTMYTKRIQAISRADTYSRANQREFKSQSSVLQLTV